MRIRNESAMQSIILSYFFHLSDCNLARVIRVVRERTLLSRALYRDTSQKARDFATHPREIERGCSASETTLRVDDINIFRHQRLF